MRVAVAGGGPAGLYFSLLLKKGRPADDIVVFERNPPGATYGWGVVFSDRTLASFREADFETYTQIVDNFIVWDAIDVCYRDEVVRCGGQVFSGISRKVLLGLLEARARGLGVEIEHEREVASLDDLEGFDLVVAADGVRSVIREAHHDVFVPRMAYGRSRYIWFGTRRAFDSFTFVFRENDDGFFQAHAYPFEGSTSTFIVECDETTWQKAGLGDADETESIAYCEKLFAADLRGHSLVSNNSKWINFVTLKNKTWHHGNVVLVGDAAHTAHFSIGSGTKLAMEDSIALANSLVARDDLHDALVEYQLERKPRVERFQDAARQSQTYFEMTSAYRHMEAPQFAFHLLSRSGRIDYDDLRLRDRAFVANVDRWFASSGASSATAAFAPPPAFAPLQVRGLRIANRVVQCPPPSYSSRDGSPPWTGIAAAARSGAGLVITEPVAVSANGRVTPATPGIYRPEHASAWAAEIAAVRPSSEAAVAISLIHAGPRGATRARRIGADVPLAASEAWPLVAASPIAYAPQGAVPAELERPGMDEVVGEFVSATRLAEAAGFDALELHVGHGYLLATFISPLTNHREDEYGGSLSNRLRFPLEIVEAVRTQWPNDRPLIVALSASDWARGGLSLEDACSAASRFKQHGCDVIRVLAGQTMQRHRPRYDPYYLTHYADRVRNQARVVTIATGSISTIDDVNTIVAAGRADLCVTRFR